MVLNLFNHERNLSIHLLLAIVLAVAAGCSQDAGTPPPSSERSSSAAGEAVVDLSPESWPADVLAAYLNSMSGEPLALASGVPEAEGTQGLVASTSSALAVHAGAEALRQGGNAADAALTVALTQVAAHIGGATSYAGQLAGMFFEAATGKVHSLDASYATVAGENDPLTIPPYGTPSGRAVLVPGFMAGVESFHERFGVLPFGELFEPAIFLAERGFVLSPTWAAMLQQRQHVITRRPEGRLLFKKKDGSLLTAGDLVRQPAVAGFLKKIVEQGADYMYRGAWADEFVASVQEEGGAMTRKDLESYKVSWNEPAPTNIRGFQVFGPQALMEELLLVEAADLRSRGHYSESPEALYSLIKFSRVSDVLGPHLSGVGASKEDVAAIAPSLDVSEQGRFSDATTKHILELMDQPAWRELEAKAAEAQLAQAELIANLIKDFGVRKPSQEDEKTKTSARPDHTAGIVVVDEAGNMAAITHSVTSAVWGEVGIFVEGVSVVDPGAFAQSQILAAGPGNLLTAGFRGAGACPAIVLKNSKPHVGCGNVGASYDVVALQGLTNIVEYGLSIKDTAAQPMFRKDWPPGLPVKQPKGEGEFRPELLNAVQAMGIPIESVDDPATATAGGILVLGSMDPQTGELAGAVTSGGHSRISASDLGLVEVF